MKGLHNVRAPSPRTIARWYGAQQNRLGRRHVIHVPLYEVDVNHMQPPYSVRYSMNPEERTREWRERMARMGRNLFSPKALEPDGADYSYRRECRTTQEVEVWRRQPEPSYDRRNIPRGFCATCYTFAASPEGRHAFLADRVDFHPNTTGHLAKDPTHWEAYVRDFARRSR